MLIGADGKGRPNLLPADTAGMTNRLRALLTLPVSTLWDRLLGRLWIEPETAAALTDTEQAWVDAHQHPVPADAAHGTTQIMATAEVQQWMARVLTDSGWTVEAPLMVTEGWVAARTTDDHGQPFVTFTTPGKSSAFARATDPATAKAAGAATAARQSITPTSHHGLILLAYAHHQNEHPGRGMTAAEAVVAANLQTDDATGSAWHRVSDLRDRGLLTPRLDSTGERVRRRNTSGSEAEVLVLTALGSRAHAALDALAQAGHPHQPLTFGGGYTPDTLFGDDVAALAHVATDQ